MIRILLVPSSDYLAHPFLQRHNQIFERLHDGKNFEVHVARFCLFEKPKLKSKLYIHDLSGSPGARLGAYYVRNALRHAREIDNLVRNEGIDFLVLSNLTAPFFYVLMNRLSRKKIPTIMDLPDYYPTLATGFLCDVKSLPGRCLSASLDLMLRYMIRRVSAVTAPSFELLRYAKSCGATNAFHVPNGVSEEFLKPREGKSLRRKLGFTPEEVVVGYIGSVEPWLDMKSLLTGISLTKRKGLRVRALLIGKGLHKQHHSNRVSDWIIELGLQEDVVRLGFVPYEDVPNYMATLDVGTIPFDVHNKTAYYSAPNKMWEYLGQMKPTISTPIPEALLNEDSVLVARQISDYVRYFHLISSKESSVLEKVFTGHSKAVNRTWNKAAVVFGDVCRGIVEKGSTRKI